VLLTEYSKYVLALARGIVPPRQTADGIALAEASAPAGGKPPAPVTP